MNHKPDLRNIYPHGSGRIVKLTIGSGDARLMSQRYFSKTVPLQQVQAWRDREKADLWARARVASRPAPIVPSLDGFCYLYVVRVGATVKIGRALDVRERLRALQVASPHPLELIAAVPAHAALEPAIHKRFEHLRENGEWFRLDDELVGFVAALNRGENPIALLFDFDDAQAAAR